MANELVKANGQKPSANGQDQTPHDRKAECALLGSLLHSPQSLCDVANIVRADDFHLDAHQRVYRAITARWDSGKPLDLVTLADDLKKSGDIEDVGGYGYLGELWGCGGTGSMATHYAGIVREKGILRSLIRVGSEIQRSGREQSAPADELLTQAERAIMEVSLLGSGGAAVSLEEAMSEAMDRIDARTRSKGKVGTTTGFIDLDEITSGLQDSELTIVAARPSVGKTSLGTAMAVAAAKTGKPVFFVSLEQSRMELCERMLAMESRVDSHSLRTGRLSAVEQDRLMEGNARICKLPVFVDDEACQTMMRIAANARRFRQRKKASLVVVDYLQLVDSDNRRMSRHEQVADVSRRLQLLAKELKIPVVAMAQLNRDAEDRMEPKLRDLRESGAIEQDADTVILMHREDDTQVHLNVAKNRNGRTGRCTLMFRKEYTRFENAAMPLPTPHRESYRDRAAGEKELPE